jgi:transcriptional regulator with XRE-family HTH domain
MRDVSQIQTLTLGERIKAARKRAGLSHDRLGAAAGTSRQHLIRLEKNIHRPKPELLARIAEATGTPLAELADPNEDDEEADQMLALELLSLIRRVRTPEVAA